MKYFLLDTHFPRVGQSHGVVRAAGHLGDDLIQQVARHQHRRHLLIGCPVSQLAVTVMTPGKNCSIWATNTQLVCLDSFHSTKSRSTRGAPAPTFSGQQDVGPAAAAQADHLLLAEQVQLLRHDGALALRRSQTVATVESKCKHLIVREETKRWERERTSRNQ